MSIPEYPFFVGNKREITSEKLEVINPYDKNAIGYVYLASLNHIKSALETALLVQPVISRIKFPKRAIILEKIHNTILEKSREFEELIVKESGKSIASAKSEVQNSLIFIRRSINYYSEQEKRALLSSGARGIDYFTISKREGMGVIFATNSYRYPLFSIVKKITLAILSSSPIIIFPSLETPLVSLQIGLALETFDLPNGWVSILCIPRSLFKEAISDFLYSSLWIEDEEISDLRREITIDRNIILEQSENSCTIIENADNVDELTSESIQSSFSFAGQAKNSIKYIYVNENIYHSVATSLVKISGKLKSGDPASAKSDIGPVINARSVESFNAFLAWAKKSNLRIIHGGGVDENMIEPTIVTNPQETFPSHGEIGNFPVLMIGSYNNFESTLSKILRQKNWPLLSIFSVDLNNSFLLSRFGFQNEIFINKIPDEFSENNSNFYIEDKLFEITRRRTITVYSREGMDSKNA